MDNGSRRKEYESKIVALAEESAQLEKISFRYSIFRLAIILLLVVVILGLWNTGPLYIVIATLIGVALFLYILKQHQHVQHQISYQQAMIEIMENEINLSAFKPGSYYNGKLYNNDSHLYTGDLDVYGRHSLYEQLNRAKSYHGNVYLHNRLSSKGSFHDVKRHQEATMELVNQPAWRHDFQAILWNTESAHDFNHYDYLFKSLQLDTDFAYKPWVKWLTPALPIAWTALGILAYLGWPYASVIGSALFIITLCIYFTYFTKISAVQSQLTQCKQILGPYSEAIQHIRNFSWQAPLNQEYLASIGNKNSSSGLARLGSLLDKLDYRLNFIVGTFLNLGFFWDFHIVRKIQEWKDNNGDEMESIFDCIGHMELITSMSTYGYNHNGYSFPDVSNEAFLFQGKDVKHPLIDPLQSVGNDINFQSEPGVRIITGSNMSGKSTLLRTMGTNMVLAYAGTVCSGKNLHISHQDIFSYMRIKDALEENVSTFKAELNRIQLMLDRLKQDNNVVLLIDEMLRGTNSKDKLKGSISITQKLMDQDAQAFIATHDLQLAEYVDGKTDLPANYFFDISFQDGELEFDYKLKEGICSNFNASFLLAKMGL